MIHLCFKYQSSENLKPVHEKAAQNLNRIANGFIVLVMLKELVVLQF
jgi:hypothetical protein